MKTMKMFWYDEDSNQCMGHPYKVNNTFNDSSNESMNVLICCEIVKFFVSLLS